MAKVGSRRLIDTAPKSKIELLVQRRDSEPTEWPFVPLFKSRMYVKIDRLHVTHKAMSSITPFIRINDGKCREAMEFYKTCFNGEIESLTVKDSPMAKDMPTEKHGLIMHSLLKVKGNIILIGMDMMRDRAVIGDNVGISVECASEKELKDLFAKLEIGGEVFMAPDEQFWGGVFGVVTDKYGVEWMMNFQKHPMKTA